MRKSDYSGEFKLMFFGVAMILLGSILVAAGSKDSDIDKNPVKKIQCSCECGKKVGSDE